MPREVGYLVEHRVGRLRGVAQALDIQQRRLQRRRQQALQVAARQLWFGVFGGNDFTCSVSRSEPFTAPGGWARMA